MQKKIAIIGACCSRDLFNAKFVPDWKDYFEVVYYAFQTSFISLMSAKIPYSQELLDSKELLVSEEQVRSNRWYRDILEKELNKSYLSDLISLKPDNILLDFYSDVFNGVIKINKNSYVTQRTKDQRNNRAFDEYINCDQVNIIDNRDEYFDLWKKYIEEFLGFLESNLPDTKILINKIRFSNVLRLEDGKTESYKYEKTDLLNELYTEMLEYVESLKHDITIVDLGKSYEIDKNYIFGGPWIVHYVNEYYHDLLNELYDKAIG